jgi:hypothetical protein
MVEYIVTISINDIYYYYNMSLHQLQYAMENKEYTILVIYKLLMVPEITNNYKSNIPMYDYRVHMTSTEYCEKYEHFYNDFDKHIISTLNNGG